MASLLEPPEPRRRRTARMEVSCLELALEGERSCKAGDFQAGVAFFEEAVQVGTEDLKTLSAIYSQLGNAYFYLKEYAKALEYHKHDLTLARTIGDRIGEAKASGNLGNTLKVLGQFEEAVVCCQRHLDITQEQGDKVGEARALYNIGNVYHAQGKQLSWTLPPEPGHLPQEVREILEKASEFYEKNLSLVKELGDRAAQGRAFGNLGNTHYLLGNFGKAVGFHKQRLAIAKEFGDRSAERRAYSNLGNAHIFLGRFDISVEYYKKTLQLSRQLKDQAVEAQSCYSLGNTYTLLQDYEKAIEYHLKHLQIAQELGDRVGEGRACWSLENAYNALGNHEEALRCAKQHLEISQEIGDQSGEITACMNVAQLESILGLKLSSDNLDSSAHYLGYEVLGNLGQYTPSCCILGHAFQLASSGPSLSKQVPLVPGPQSVLQIPQEGSSPGKQLLEVLTEKLLAGAKPKRTQRSIMDSLDLLRFPSEKDQNGENHHTEELRITRKDFLSLPIRSHRIREATSVPDRKPAAPSDSPLETSDVQVQVSQLKIQRAPSSDEECFFDLLSKFQSNRMDDQRCTLEEGQKETGDTATDATPVPALDERLSQSSSMASPQTEALFDLIASSQSRRLDDQRASMGSLPGLRITHNNLGHLRMEGDSQEPGDEFFNMLMKCQSSRIDDQRCAPPNAVPRGPTMPDEDFFSLIQRVQAKRMDEQRVDLNSAQEEGEEEEDQGEDQLDQQEVTS